MAAKTQRMIVHRRRYRERESEEGGREGGSGAAFQTVTIAVVTALAPSSGSASTAPSPPSLFVRPPKERADDRPDLVGPRSLFRLSRLGRPSAVGVHRSPPAVLGMRVVTTCGGSSKAAADRESEQASERDGLTAVDAVDRVDAGGGGG